MTHDFQSAADPVRTGNDTVDEVLASLDGLDEAEIHEHVAVFEHAHERLRAALDARANPIPSALRPGGN
jgi:hypothetical protein